MAYIAFDRSIGTLMQKYRLLTDGYYGSNAIYVIIIVRQWIIGTGTHEIWGALITGKSMWESNLVNHRLGNTQLLPEKNATK